jgi:hypothetical protein
LHWLIRAWLGQPQSSSCLKPADRTAWQPGLCFDDLCFHRGELPGLVLSWDKAESAAAFDKLFDQIAAEAFWCCFTWGEHDQQYRTLPYARPRPYSEPCERAGDKGLHVHPQGDLWVACGLL